MLHDIRAITDPVRPNRLTWIAIAFLQQFALQQLQ